MKQTGKTTGGAAGALALLLLFALPLAAQFAPVGDKMDVAGLDDLLADLGDEMPVGLRYRLVAVDAPEQGLADQVYWRELPGAAAAATFPVRFALDGHDLIVPVVTPDDKLGLLHSYPTEVRAPAPRGRATLMPGRLTIEPAAGGLRTNHPALRGGKEGLDIVCAPIRFEARSPSGVLLPQRVEVRWDNQSLLRAVKEFMPLTIWLPVGLTYQSTFGSFSVSETGEATAAGQPVSGVRIEGRTLTMQVAEPPPAPRQSTPAEAGLWLHSQRGRTAFTHEEAPWLHLLASGPRPAGQAVLHARRVGEGALAEALGTLSAPPNPADFELGAVDLPAIAGADFDGRSVQLPAALLPPGRYEIWLAEGERRSPAIAFELVPWQRRSSFLVQTMSCCTAAPANDPPGLALLCAAGLEMTTATGHFSEFDFTLPKLGPPRAGEPAELALRTTQNDRLLENFTRFGMRNIDLIVARRPGGMYNEGLSYHHSYPPSVERMVRRLQLAAQQTADYPAWWGGNYSWFPSLHGYVEGGVPTDAHTRDRMEALNARLREEGVLGLGREEALALRRAEDGLDPALAARHVAHWRRSYELGFAEHNAIYNAALRRVRPDIVTTLFENAGHDSGKLGVGLWGAMAAVTYETYTDHGDWPMSAGFTVDWARGMVPGKPVWLTTSWGTSAEGKAKSLFQAMLRGLDGGGVPMQADAGEEALRLRGRALQAAAAYGPATRLARPDGRVAILARTADQPLAGRALFVYHAFYYHLQRLGHAAILINGDELGPEGFPAGLELLVIPPQVLPLGPALDRAVDAFRQRGGKLLTSRNNPHPPAGATVVQADLRHIWQFSGFQATIHGEFWQEFSDRWREPLSQALAELGLEPLVRTDPELAYGLAADLGPVRYVAVIADRKGAHSNDFQATAKLPVSLAGTGWRVRHLFHQVDLPVQASNGRSEVVVDLVTEPVVLLALYREAPAAVTVALGPAQAGGQLVVSAAVATAAGADLGAVPLAITVRDPHGFVWPVYQRTAGERLALPLPILGAAGDWSVEVQELLTGLRATVAVPVGAGPAPELAPAPAGHLVDARQVHDYLAKPSEKWILLDWTQASLLPLAERLAAGLRDGGQAVRIWQVRPEERENHPIRWYPRPEDEERLAAIRAGRLVGRRENLDAYIDTRARLHLPERGGYTENDPPWMVGGDCILFSGSFLAESLRDASAWVNTPNLPGRGHGRVVVAFSPFMANCDAILLAANDPAGLAAAVDALVQAAGAAPPTPPVAAAPPLQPRAATLAPAQVAMPMHNYVPIRRFTRLLANPAGQAVAAVDGDGDNLVFVDVDGTLLGSLHSPGSLAAARLDDEGGLWLHQLAVTARHPSWGYPTGYTIALERLLPSGETAVRLPVWNGPTEDLPNQWRFETSFQPSPAGDLLACGRPGALIWGQPGEPIFHRLEAMPWFAKRHQVWNPAFPVDLVFDPSGRFCYALFDTRPPGFAGMNRRALRPTDNVAMLVDTQTGTVLWQLDNYELGPGHHAGLQGFVAVARDGGETAIADFAGHVQMVNKAGHVRLRTLIHADQEREPSRRGPPNGLGVQISDDGGLAAFVFTDQVVLIAGDKLERLATADNRDFALARDGSQLVLAKGDGSLAAFGPAGEARWQRPAEGVRPLLAPAAGGDLLVALSNGELIRLDGNGKEVWRAQAAAQADLARNPAKPAAADQPGPLNYVDPGTLAYAQEHLQARELSRWTPAGERHEAFAKLFHATTEISLQAAPEQEAFLHLVYRRPGPEPVKVAVTDADGVRDYLLDLPTPEYRVLNLPMRGQTVSVTVSSAAPFLLAEASIHQFAWPSPNLAYVAPPDLGAGAVINGGRGKLEDIFDDLDGSGSNLHGKMKDSRIWVFNNDVDRVAGLWLPGAMDSLAVLDGKRWNRPPAWAARNFAGAWFTVDFGTATEIGLVATYDRSLRQSELSERLVVFTDFESTDPNAHWSNGRLLAGAMENDQFWRLLPLPAGPAKLRQLGVQVLSPAGNHGLAEVEAYR